MTQVKAYPNIGASIVDAGRYMNQLAMDVATFTLVDVLASEKASRTNPQGTEVAQWLESKLLTPSYSRFKAYRRHRSIRGRL